MTLKNAALAFLYVDFLVLTGIAIAQHGITGIFAVGLQDTAGAQVFMDLCIALLIATGWLIGDARKRGLNPWPWVVATPFLGSIAPLTYVLYRAALPEPTPAHAA